MVAAVSTCTVMYICEKEEIATKKKFLFTAQNRRFEFFATRWSEFFFSDHVYPIANPFITPISKLLRRWLFFFVYSLIQFHSFIGGLRVEIFGALETLFQLSALMFSSQQIWMRHIIKTVHFAGFARISSFISIFLKEKLWLHFLYKPKFCSEAWLRKKIKVILKSSENALWYKPVVKSDKLFWLI